MWITYGRVEQTILLNKLGNQSQKLHIPIIDQMQVGMLLSNPMQAESPVSPGRDPTSMSWRTVPRAASLVGSREGREGSILRL